MRVVEAVKAAHVWCPKKESEPEGLFNKASCPGAPAQWFREAPECAAELYALEMHSGPQHQQVEVCVRDDAGVLYRFDVMTGYELLARVVLK